MDLASSKVELMGYRSLRFSWTEIQPILAYWLTLCCAISMVPALKVLRSHTAPNDNADSHRPWVFHEAQGFGSAILLGVISLAACARKIPALNSASSAIAKIATSIMELILPTSAPWLGGHKQMVTSLIRRWRSELTAVRLELNHVLGILQCLPYPQPTARSWSDERWSLALGTFIRPRSIHHG
jgi:hypothetical protein